MLSNPPSYGFKLYHACLIFRYTEHKLSKDPVTDCSHLRDFCKVVLQRCLSVSNIDDNEPRCRALLNT
uniref:Uncharacterized protein n=1 Tax=Setaria italica TaxID=4555 RepID=K3YXF6_SETIT